MGHLFARLWQWWIVRNVWTVSATELHGHVRILLHLSQFCIRRHWRRQLLRRKKMMMVFVANCVATIPVIYASVCILHAPA